jgi:hypothetical protein
MYNLIHHEYENTYYRKKEHYPQLMTIQKMCDIKYCDLGSPFRIPRTIYFDEVNINKDKVLVDNVYRIFGRYVEQKFIFLGTPT